MKDTKDKDCLDIDCDFVEIWPNFDELRCKHHRLKTGDRKIITKKIPKWCPVIQELMDERKTKMKGES